MVKEPTSKWKQFLESKLLEILSKEPIRFCEIERPVVPIQAGVYLITIVKSTEAPEEPYYAGEAGDLRRRIITNHFRGKTANSQFRKYMIQSGECAGEEQVSQLLINCGQFRWIQEDDVKKRKAIEAYVKSLLLPKYAFTGKL